MNKIIIVLISVALIVASFFIGYSIDKPDSTSVEIQNLQNQIDSIEEQNSQLQIQNNQLSEQVTELQKQIDEREEEPDTPEVSPVTLSIKKESSKVIFTAETSGNVYMPNSSYWNPTGSWQIYRYVDGDWTRITPSRHCNTFCDSICETGPLSCVAGGSSPICQLASSKEDFEWNKQYVDYKDKVCDTETYECAYYKDAESGKYKVAFTYKTDCSEGQLFGSNPIIIEKEFSI